MILGTCQGLRGLGGIATCGGMMEARVLTLEIPSAPLVVQCPTPCIVRYGGDLKIWGLQFLKLFRFSTIFHDWVAGVEHQVSKPSVVFPSCYICSETLKTAKQRESEPHMSRLPFPILRNTPCIAQHGGGGYVEIWGLNLFFCLNCSASLACS